MREADVDAFLQGQSNLRDGLKALPLIAG